MIEKNINSNFFNSDLFYSFLIIFLFSIICIIMIFTIAKNNILNNLETYRCNPGLMPYMDLFGINSKNNFDYCIKNAQTQYMGNILRPVNNKIHKNSDNVNNLSSSINEFKKFVHNLRNNVGNSVNNVYNSMGNMALQQEKIQHKNNDNFSRLVGAITTNMYVNNVLDNEIVKNKNNI